MSNKGALVTLENPVAVPRASMMPVTWSTVVYDTHRIVSGTALKVPRGAKWVRISFQVKWDSDQTVGYRIAQVRKNGTDDTQIPESRIAAAPETYTTQNASTPPIAVRAGDLFELWVGQGSPNDVHMFPHQTWFAMEIIGPVIRATKKRSRT